MRSIRITRLAFTATFVAAVLSAGCASLPNNDYPELAPLDTQLPVQRAWLRLQLNHAENNTGGWPVHADASQVVWSDFYGIIIVYNAKSGRVLSRFETEKPISSAVGADSERFYVGTIKGEVIALTRATGQVDWIATVGSEVLAPPQVAHDVLVVMAVDGRVYGFNVANGRELWRYESTVPPLSLRGTAIPKIVDDRVLLGLANGKLVALNLWDGKERWRLEIAQSQGRSELDRMVDVDATPVVDEDVVFASAYKGRVIAANVQSGRTLWARDVASTRGMAVRGEILYVTSDDGSLWALKKTDGQVMWRQRDLEGRQVTGPAIYGDYVLVGDGAGWVHWIDAVSGVVLHRVRVDTAPVAYPPVVVGDRAYIVSGAGVLDALTLGVGETPSTAEMPSADNAAETP